MKVLVVDTDQISRMVVEQCVSVLGHETLHAENGKHGLAYAKDNNVDLIFMDEEMSDINAPVATKVLRTIKNDDWIPIVYLTNRTGSRFLSQRYAGWGGRLFTEAVKSFVFAVANNGDGADFHHAQKIVGARSVSKSE